MGLPAPKLPPKPSYPKTRVEGALDKWWRAQERATARHGNPFSDAATKSGTVFGIQPQVSSQEAVTVLIELKVILGYEPSSNVIKRGGYKSRDEFVRDLTTAVEQEHLKKNH